MIKILQTLFFILFAQIAQGQAPKAELIIGVVPNLSARVINVNYQPFADYFEKNLGRDVRITTGTSFPNFYQRALANEFQMMVTAPNLARVSQLDGNWEPVAVLEPGIPGLLVGLNSRDNNLELLRGKKLAIANPQSLVALAGLDWLDKQGLKAGRDYEIIRIANDDSLGTTLKTGEAAFAIMSQGEFNAKSPELKKILTPVNTFVRLPGFFIMVNKSLTPTEMKKIRGLIQDFPKSTQAAAFFSLSGFTGLSAPTANQIALLDAFEPATRQGLLSNK